jgi:hypothetical protein
MACMGMQGQSSESDLKQDIAVKLQVPDSGWRIRILEVYRVHNELLVITEVYRMKGMAAQVISTVEDKVTVSAPALPITHFIIGKTWNWSDGSPYKFIDSKDAINKDLKAGECLYKKNIQK